MKALVVIFALAVIFAALIFIVGGNQPEAESTRPPVVIPTGTSPIMTGTDVTGPPQTFIPTVGHPAFTPHPTLVGE